MADAFLVRLARGLAWDYSVPRRAQANGGEHATFMDGLAAEGFVILGGPVGEGGGDDVVVVAADEATIRARLADDPWPDDLLTIRNSEPWSVWLRAPTGLDASAPVP